jgi:hypothetical protein
MADRFELVAIALPADCAPESLAPVVATFIAACWNGMSRAQLFERARRAGLHVSLRMLPGLAVDGVQRHALQLSPLKPGNGHESRIELVAHVRRIVRRRGVRRAKASLPPVRDVRQGGLL